MACIKVAKTYYEQIDSNGFLRSGRLVLTKRKKFKAFLQTDAGKDMLKYYHKATDLGYEEAKKELMN